MKNKHYAPGNKKPNKNKSKNTQIDIENVPDFYFSNGPSSRRRCIGIQIPYLLNHRTNITKNRFN